MKKAKNELNRPEKKESDFSKAMKIAAIAFAALLILGIIIMILSIKLSGMRLQ